MRTLSDKLSKSTNWSYRTIFFCTVILAMLVPTSVLAHPLGNFTINRYSRLDVGEEQITLTYVVDMAEVPMQQERPVIDTDSNGILSTTELEAYLNQTLPALMQNLSLTINGQAHEWAVVSKEIAIEEGQAGLPTLRFRSQFASRLDLGQEPLSVLFQDGNYAERLGWQEVIVKALDGVQLIGSNVPDTDLSNELTEYPADLLQSPPTADSAQFQYQSLSAAGTSSQSLPVIPNSEVVDNVSADAGSHGEDLAATSDPFAELIHLPDLGPWTLFLALLAAFGWGAAHALSPGHGKTIVGAYLVGSRGTAKHALFLGLTTTITHTAGVFALGLITLFASRYILPETIFPWLSLFSGLLVVVIGLSMAWNWYRRFRAQGTAHHDHAHGHTHHHSHDEHHAHGHDDGVHDHDGLHTHDGIHYHTHEVPGQDGEPVTWRSLLALGISGGLLPCPSALVVMLGAIALQRVAFGLVLIIAFSLGLAGVLTAIGLALVYAGHFFAKFPESGRVLKLLPVASALFITTVGLGIAWQAMIGIL